MNKLGRSLLLQIRRDMPFIVVAGFVVVILGSVVISAGTWGVLGPLTTRVETNQKVIALTFDDGPTQPETSRLLAVLKEEQVKATFYLIGVEMVRQPEATNSIIAAGHEIGNHSYTHNTLMFMSWGNLSREIELTDDLIKSHGYKGDITIRPPYGHKLIELPVYTALHNRQLIMWDTVLGNERGITIDKILRDAKQRIRPGSIVIMHAMYAHNKTTLDSVRPLIKQLKADGYRFVTVSELLRYRQ